MANGQTGFSRALILASVAAIALIPQAANAQGERARVAIPSQPLGDALSEFARQSRQSLLYSPEIVRGRQAPAVNGDYTPQEALTLLLNGSGRTVRQTPNGAFLISAAEPPRAQRIQIASQTIAPMMMQSAASAVPVEEPRTALEEVVVTGSRIRTNGNDLPTPVTIVSAAQLQQTTPSNIPDALNKLPSFNSQSTPNNATTGANGRGFNTPGNYLNMRNLGAIRTLILEDGRRVPGTFYDTTVDTDMLPQMLIQRVEVVTGGASAVYGSDAVSGVVNFIIDKNFNGFKGVVQGGTSKYGDADSVRVGLANGFNVGERGHFEWSAEYYNRNAIKDQSARPYGDLGAAVVGGGTAANPYELVYGIHQSNTAYGGLVRTGPFAGQQFRDDGTLGPFAVGTPTRSGNISVGGDGGIQTEGYLIPSRRTAQVFGRFDYEVSDTVHAYVQARYAKADSYTANQSYTNSETAYPLYIYSRNAYLRPEYQAQLTAAGVSSFRLNRFNQDLMKDLALDSEVQAGALTAGLSGELFGDFTWDLFYTHGDTKTRLTTVNNVNSMNFFAAADAVRDPATGQIVCRVSLTAPGAFPGCAPLNLFGQNNASQAAKDFIYQDTEWVAKNGLDDWGAYITGTAFEGPAGPVKVAAGGEYRRADLKVTTTVPSTTFNPQYLRLGELGNSATTSYPGSNLAFFKEAQSAADASETVAEANVEVNAPLLRDLPLVKLLSVNAAARYTKYTTEGNGLDETEFTAKTWKLGAEWQVTDDVRVRATRSRDIRAPTLWDLYQQQIVSSSGISDPLTGVAGQANTVAGGNPDLRPEVAQNTTAGIVYRPAFLPNFSVSVDWYRIKIGNAIGAVNGLNPIIQGLCFDSGGSSPYCDLVDRPISYNSTAPGNFPIRVYNLSQNIAKVYAEGVDLEANYTQNLEEWMDFGGYLNLRLLWTHQHILKTTSLPNAATTNAAGTSAAPQDKLNFTASYVRDRFSATVSQRWASSFTHSANPLQVFNIPDVGPYEQTDINLAYDFMSGDRTLTGFLNVSNLFNNNGDLYQVPGYTGSPGMNYPQGPQADLIGRYVTVGVRFKM